MAPSQTILYSRCNENRGRQAILTEQTRVIALQTQPGRLLSGWRVLLLCGGLAAAVISPMIFLGNAAGHDLLFHIASWVDVAGQWREGIFSPQWAEWANWGFGEPRFIFYPPGSWLVGAALGMALPWKLVPGAYVWLVLTAAGMSMWRLGRDYLPGPYEAIAAALYVVNPYNLLIVYYRSAYAELLACAFYPLLIWAGCRVASGNWQGMPALAAALAGIWLANAPAAVVATYSLCLILLGGCVLRRSLRPLFPGAASIALGMGLAAFYIFPAAWEQRWVQITEVVSEHVQPASNFLFTRANAPEFALFNAKVSWIAIGMMVCVGIAVVLTARRRWGFGGIWWTLAAVGAASSALMFEPSLVLWRTLPKMWFVQFPWRWMGMLAVVFAFSLAAAISCLQTARATSLAVIFLGCAILATAASMVRDAWWNNDDVESAATAIASGRGYEGTNEYAPAGCLRYDLPGNPDDASRPDGISAIPAPPVEILGAAPGASPASGEAQFQIREWSAERKVVTEHSALPVMFAFRLINYPAWEARMDGTEILAGSLPNTAQIVLPLPPGAHRVEIRLRHTWDRTAGGVISVLSAAAFFAIFWRLRVARAARGASG